MQLAFITFVAFELKQEQHWPISNCCIQSCNTIEKHNTIYVYVFLSTFNSDSEESVFLKILDTQNQGS